jgi:hypothetical protein
LRTSIPTDGSTWRSRGRFQLGPILILALFIGLYPWLRFGGRLGGGDTSRISEATWAILDSGQLIPEDLAYPNGYGYQALLLHLSALTGLSLAILQSLGGVLLFFWAVLPAWLAYREFTSSEATASLATLILVIQPEFIFPLLRGTHEKFTRGLMFLLLFLLLRSLRATRLQQLASLVVAFYLSAYAMITFNSLMAISFVSAIGLAWVLLWGVGRRPLLRDGRQSPMLRRLAIIIASLLGLGFLFLFYAYPPAQKQLALLQSTGDRLFATFLGMEERSFNPYDTIARGWVSLPVYLLVSLSNWILMTGAALVWLWQGWQWFFWREQPERPALLLWSFCGAFAFQSAVSIAVDLSGAIAGNLQHRIFPSFVMLAAPLVAVWIVTQRQRLSERRRGWLDKLLGVLLGFLLLLGLIKASNEPLLSNYWTFYTTAEHSAASWADRSLADRRLWVGFNDRVGSGYQISQNGRVLALYLDAFVPVSPATRSFLISPANLLHGSRLSAPLPSALTLETDTFVTYDNGEAQIWHVRPKSMLQR